VTSPTPDEDLWTAQQAAAYLGLASAASARRALSRLGVSAARYSPHPESGRPRAEYRAVDVQSAKSNRPGRGARTDLHTTKETP
jgi:plasmid stabilization system protein ParE